MLQPDLLITETTYATTVRDSKRSRETAFLKKIKDTLDNGGKVLVPVCSKPWAKIITPPPLSATFLPTSSMHYREA